MTFLLVDDYPASRQLMRDVLECAGHSFIEASDGSEAVLAQQQHRPDWILMDIDMPGMDGLVATRIIHAHDPAVPIIVITNHHTPAMRSAAIEAGACAFLAKDDLLDLPNLISQQTAFLKQS